MMDTHPTPAELTEAGFGDLVTRDAVLTCTDADRLMEMAEVCMVDPAESGACVACLAYIRAQEIEETPSVPNYYGWLHRTTRDRTTGRRIAGVAFDQAKHLLRINPTAYEIGTATEINQAIDESVTAVIKACEGERYAIHYLLVLYGQQNAELERLRNG